MITLPTKIVVVSEKINFHNNKTYHFRVLTLSRNFYRH